MLLRSTATPVSVWSAARIFLITSFVGTALPAGGADVTRAYALSQHTNDGHEAFASVAVDRLLGVTALLVLGVVGLTLWTGDVALPLAGLVVGLCAVTAITLLGAFWAGEVLRVVVPPALRRLPPGRWLIETAESVARYRARRGTLLTVFALSLMVQWLRILEVFLLGDGLGVEVDLSYYLVFMPVGLLAFMLPISSPDRRHRAASRGHRVAPSIRRRPGRSGVRSINARGGRRPDWNASRAVALPALAEGLIRRWAGA